MRAQLRNFDAQIASARANLKTSHDEETVSGSATRNHEGDREHARDADGKGSRLEAEFAAVS